MFSVLIFDEKTKKSYDSFSPLFRAAIDSGEVAVCTWNDPVEKKDESGKQDKTVSAKKGKSNADIISEVLPKIYELVGAKKEWRAIVVQSSLPPEDESELLSTDRKNPFDFNYYRNKRQDELERIKYEKSKLPKSEHRYVLDENCNMHEPSPIPLVRLAQMLGGVPEPDIILTPFNWDPSIKEKEEEREALLASLNLDVQDDILEEDAAADEVTDTENSDISVMESDVESTDDASAVTEDASMIECEQVEAASKNVSSTVPVTIAPFDTSTRKEWKNISVGYDPSTEQIKEKVSLVYYPENLSRREEKDKSESKWATKVVHDYTAEEVYKELSRKYRFKANPPKEIIMVAARPQVEESIGMIKDSWKNYDELQSSQFWHYNHYPQNTRFITYEIEQRGSLQEQGDLFMLWLSMMLIATNSFDPSSFQSQRLYKMNLKLKKQELAETLRASCIRLDTAAEYYKKCIDSENQKKMNERIDPPYYDTPIHVDVYDRNIGALNMENGNYGLAARDFNDDSYYWNEEKKEVDKNIVKLRRNTGRAVENSAERMSGRCEYDEMSVVPLSNFQATEFSDQLKDTFDKMLTGQAELGIAELSELKNQEEDKNKLVHEKLSSRMNGKKIFGGYLISQVAGLLVALPSLIHAYTSEQSVRVPLFASLLGISVVYFVGIFVCVWVQRRELLSVISSFNFILDEIRRLLEHSAEAYSEFLSSVASYMKGSSYLNILRRKTFDEEDLSLKRRKDLRAVLDFKQKLEEWGKAVYVKFDYDDSDREEIDYNSDNVPDLKTLFSISTDKVHKIPVNDSGNFMSTKYNFIEKIEVIREELYDDNISSS